MVVPSKESDPEVILEWKRGVKRSIVEIKGGLNQGTQSSGELDVAGA
jgi:hypothetical protein